MTYLSKMTSGDWRYPQPALKASGHLTVSREPQHEIYWEEYGHPEGEPVMFLHGGPGGATTPALARFFDPKRYRIVLFDQRGCGKSRPSASDLDARAALADNTTDALIADIGALRAHLRIEGKMHVFGGSWGSTLALAYAIAAPETVASLILRGIFLCRRKDVDYFYQGNAQTYADNPYDTQLAGTYQFFPDAWKRFVEVISPADRGDMVRAYADIFAHAPTNAAEERRLLDAAGAWSVWEGVTSYLSQDMSDLSRFSDAAFAKAFARIENHYFMNGAFLGGKGPSNRDQDFILSHVDRIASIPVYIVHGRYDVVCPMFQAEELVSALKSAGAKQVHYHLTPAGHSMQERETNRVLSDIMDALPRP